MALWAPNVANPLDSKKWGLDHAAAEKSTLDGDHNRIW